MKNRFISGFVCGAVLFGAVAAFAGQYVATENSFPVQLNGDNVSIEGYNIEGSSYFKLRDIADSVGGFSVDFADNTIRISTDVQNNVEPTVEPTAEPEQDSLTAYEQELSKYKFSDVAEGYWQHNSSDMGAYYVIHLTENLAIKDYGYSKLFGTYEIKGNRLSVTFYKDISRTAVSETADYDYYNGRLYIVGKQNDYLRKMTD